MTQKKAQLQPLIVTVELSYDPSTYLDHCAAENLKPSQAEFREWVSAAMQDDLLEFREDHPDVEVDAVLWREGGEVRGVIEARPVQN